MTEEEARHFSLVRAVELDDRQTELLTREDRQQAEAFALREAGGGGETPDAYLARRAEFASGRLTTRNPLAARTVAAAQWPGWLSVTVPLIAFVAGAGSNELANGNRLDLLAFPLLGIFVWNLAVYAGLLVSPFLPAPSEPRGSALLHWIAALGQRKFDDTLALTRALGRFTSDWWRASARLNGARMARTFHLGAACFALGLIAGIFVRALAVEYRAGWESTFLGAGEVHALLSALLGPASALTGVRIPDEAGIAALRWTAPGIGGENAGRWIYLYTATTLGFVVIPRLLLAGWNGITAWRLARNFRLPGREDFYVRRLLRAREGGGGSVRVTPYAFAPDQPTRASLIELLRGALGDGARIRFDDPVDYGAEDSWLAAAQIDPADDYHIALFTLSATPERENHGQFVTSLAARIAAESSGTAIGLIVDESSWRAHFAGQSGLDDRALRRAEAWRAVIGNAGVAPLTLDLASADPQRDGERIESALVPGAILSGAR